MIYTSVNNRPLAEHDFNSLLAFFEQEVFFAFMDRGREGLSTIAADVVDTFAKHHAQRAKAAGSRADIGSVKDWPRIYRLAAVSIIDNFIRSGSGGIRSALYEVHSVVVDALRDAT